MSNANEPWKNKNIEIFVIKTASSRLWDVKFSMGVNLLFLAISIFSHFLSFGEMWIEEWDKATPRSLAITILTRPMSVEPQNEGWEKSQSPWRISSLRQNWGLRPAVFSERILYSLSKLWRNKYDSN